MLNIKICLFVGRVVESMLYAISVVGMNSLEYQLQRGLNRSIKFKYLVGFLRPVDFSTRNVPAETASAAQALRLGQVSLAAVQGRSGGARSRLAGPGMLLVVQPLICGCHGYLVPTNPSVFPPAATKNPTICPRSLMPLIVVVPTPSGSSTDVKCPSSKMKPWVRPDRSTYCPTTSS